MTVVATSYYAYVNGQTGIRKLRGDEVNDRGTWSIAAIYAVNDVVEFGGALYYCLAAVSGTPPTGNRSSYWSTFVLLTDEQADLTLENLYLLIVSTGSLAYTALVTAWAGTAGEANTASSAGGYSLVLTKSGTDLPFRGLHGNANIQVSSTGSTVVVDLGTIATTESTWFGPSVGSHQARAYAGTFAVDFAGSHSAYETVNLAGNLHLIAQNMGGPDNLHGVSIRIIGDGTDRDITYQSGIRWLSAPPTTQVASKIGVASFTAYGPSISDVLGVYATEQ